MAARRNAGLRRLRTLNRMLIGTAVAGTGLLTDVAAHAFPGHKRHVAAPTSTVTRARASARTRAGHRRAHRRHHHAGAAPRPPAQAPSATTSQAPAPTTTQAPAPTTPQVTTTSAPPPPPQPSPAPVTSGGS